MDKSLEKVVLPKFDKEKYFKDAEAVLAQRKNSRRSCRQSL